MKRIFILLSVLLFVTANGFAQLASYAGAGGGGTAVSGVPNETVSTLMYSGFGSNTPCSSGGLSGITVSTSWSGFSPAGPRVYLQIKPVAGFQLNVTGIDAGLRRSGTGPSCVQFAYSLDNGVTWTNDLTCHAPINSGCGSTAVSSWSPLGGALPTNITSTTNGIIVAIFPYASSNSSGTFQVNTFHVLGNVTPACTPPVSISGTLKLCNLPSSLATALGDATPGGTWSSSNTAVVNIGAGTGVLGIVAPGTSTITYATSTSCYTTAVVTVNPMPAPITGVPVVCSGFTTALSDAGGGTWSSSNISVAAVAAGTGVVSGVSAGTATIIYTLGTGCGANTTVTVNPSPAAITGTTNICMPSSSALSNSTLGGVWSSSNTSVAAVGISSGIVTPVSSGTATITYSFGSFGCYAATIVTVSPSPAAITGTPAVCTGLTTALSDVGGGTWSSSAGSVATISGSGVVSGISGGTSSITYTLGTGCATSTVVTVSPSPGAITGITAACSGLTATLSNATPGGTWSSSNTSVVSIGLTTGAYTGVAAGSATITYTLATGCIATTAITVNLLPPAIGGTTNVCIGGQTSLIGTGGTWTSGNTAVATVDPVTGVVTGVLSGTSVISYTVGTGCSSTAVVTVNSLPPAISGPANVCQGVPAAFTDIPGGTWSSGATGVATIGAGSGILTGIALGTATITYTSGFGCKTALTVTVNPVPAAITGITNVCAGLITTLSDATPAGTWSSGNTGIAGIDAVTGVVTGVTAGTASMTFTIGTGCLSAATVTVNPLPFAIAGINNVCEGSTTALSDAGAGTWSSSNTSTAAIDFSGIVTGVAAGTATITYTLSTGCIGTVPVTVNALPAPISGTTVVCEGAATSLSSATAGGSWTSGDVSVAVVGFGSGVVNAISGGTSLITYTLSTGCSTGVVVVVNPVKPISGIPYICSGLTVTLNDVIVGGTWNSSNTSVATIDIGTGDLTGVSAGTTTITYTFPSGCMTTRVVNVHPFPSPISGTPTVCEGTTTTLSDTPSGGTWSSGNTAIATVNATTGVVSGLLPGDVNITYSNGIGCSVSETVTVNVSVAPITGVHDMCNSGDTIIAYNMDAPKGIWTSSLVTVSTSGLVTAYATGAASITYTLPTGCFTTTTLTVWPVPGKIAGPATLCTGSLESFTDTTAGGYWSSLDPGVTVDPVAGYAVGLFAGTAVISYTLPAGCMVKDTIMVYPEPSVISGSGDVCLGATNALSNAIGGGSWSSSSVFVSVGAGSGDIAGIASGIAVISYTTGPNCTATKTVTVLPLPTIYTVTGGGNFCAGDTGVHIMLSGSVSGINYNLYDGGTLVGSLSGTGRSLDYGKFIDNGTYTIVAANSTTTCSKDMSGSAVVVKNPVVAPSVSISVAPGNTVCAGTPVTFTATPVNGGILPVYEWKVNGVSAGSGTSYTYTPADRDLVGIMLTSNATCAMYADAYNFTTMAVTTPLVPTVTINADPGTSIAKGQKVTLVASVTNAGSSPLYQWLKNGIPLAGETFNVYTGNDFSNFDTMTCFVTGSGMCGLSSSEKVYIHISTDAVTNPSQSKNENIIILPNPNNGDFTVKGTLGTTDNIEVSLELTNMLGQVVYTSKVTAHNGNLDEHIRSGKLANGMYLLNLRSEISDKVFHIVVEQ